MVRWFCRWLGGSQTDRWFCRRSVGSADGQVIQQMVRWFCRWFCRLSGGFTDGQILRSVDCQGVLQMVMGFYIWSGGFEDGQEVLEMVRWFCR